MNYELIVVSFTEVMTDLYNITNEFSKKKSPMISDFHYDIIMKNAERLNSAIIYDRDFSYNYFGFKVQCTLQNHLSFIIIYLFLIWFWFDIFRLWNDHTFFVLMVKLWSDPSTCSWEWLLVFMEKTLMLPLKPTTSCQKDTSLMLHPLCSVLQLLGLNSQGILK